MRSMAILDVSLWVTRENKNWQAQLRTMEAMVVDLLVQDATIVIKDYQASQTEPADTNYRIVLDDIRRVATGPDPNPDVERRRILTNYEWVIRS